MEDESLNLAYANLTLAIAASSTQIDASSVKSPKCDVEIRQLL